MIDFTKIPFKSFLTYERTNSGKNALEFLRELNLQTASATDLHWLAFFAKSAEDSTVTVAAIEALTIAEVMAIVNPPAATVNPQAATV